MIVATRELRYDTKDGHTVRIPISIFRPEETELGWKSHYAIEWPDGTEARIAYGLDAVQAILLALQAIGTAIYFSDYHRSERLYFEVPGTGYGFPVLSIARHMVIGDDRTFCS